MDTSTYKANVPDITYTTTLNNLEYSYTPRGWESGDTINEDRINNMEQGIIVAAETASNALNTAENFDDNLESVDFIRENLTHNSARMNPLIFEAEDSNSAQHLYIYMNPSQQAGTPSLSNVCPINGITNFKFIMSGKNFFPVFPSVTNAVNGLTVNTTNTTQTVNFKGTATSDTNFIIDNVSYFIPANTSFTLFAFNNKIGVQGTKIIKLYMIDSLNNTYELPLIQLNNYYTFNVDTDITLTTFGIFIPNGYAFDSNGTTLQPMATLGKTIYNKFEKYNATSFNIALTNPDTIYGGYLDLIDKKLIVTHIKKNFVWKNKTGEPVTITETKNNVIYTCERRGFPISATDAYNPENQTKYPSLTNEFCSIVPFISGQTTTPHFYMGARAAYVFLPENTDENTSFEICYPLATPKIYDIDLPQITILEGTNAVSVLEGGNASANIIISSQKRQDEYFDKLEEKILNLQNSYYKVDETINWEAGSLYPPPGSNDPPLPEGKEVGMEQDSDNYRRTGFIPTSSIDFIYKSSSGGYILAYYNIDQDSGSKMRQWRTENVWEIDKHYPYIRLTMATAAFPATIFTFYKYTGIKDEIINIKNLQPQRGFVKGIGHRGWYECPENTLVGYKEAYKRGFKYVETDVQFTQDGVPVLVHDLSNDNNGIGGIARVAREIVRNGDEIIGYNDIAETIMPSSKSYNELLTNYDFGWQNGSNLTDRNIYHDIPIATFEEFIALCRNLGLKPYVELKIDDENNTKKLVDIVRIYGMLHETTWTSFSANYLARIIQKDPTARVGLIASEITSSNYEQIFASVDSLKTSSNNEVFITLNNSNATIGIPYCKQANIPLEVWTINNPTTIAGLDPYISGVTSDRYDASTILLQKTIE